MSRWRPELVERDPVRMVELLPLPHARVRGALGARALAVSRRHVRLWRSGGRFNRGFGLLNLAIAGLLWAVGVRAWAFIFPAVTYTFVAWFEGRCRERHATRWQSLADGADVAMGQRGLPPHPIPVEPRPLASGSGPVGDRLGLGCPCLACKGLR